MPGIGDRLLVQERLIIALAAVCLAALIQAPLTSAQTQVTVAANTPDIGNCYPFGLGGDETPGEGTWKPFAAFVYKNVPPFDFDPNDAISFDTNFVNDADIKLDIALAATTTNGGDIPAGAFTKVVFNTETAAAPRGNGTVGDYDLQYEAQGGFTFAGGGLLIRTSNPASSFLADNTCTGNLVGGNGSDSSGFFVGRRVRDDDGTAPWDEADLFSVPAFRITTTATPSARCGGKTATIGGTAGPDNLHGTPGPDVIASLGGADTVSSGKGKDRVCGGPGNDRLRGGAGKDLLKGGPGRDRLRGGPGRDKLRGGPGKDLAVQ
jgi:Ca2+-binding RTX toxin-like protein